jgi:hypothetical protein
MKRAVFAVCLVMCASQAGAQGWSVTAGPGALIAPSWEGADNMMVGPRFRGSVSARAANHRDLPRRTTASAWDFFPALCA